MAIVLGEVIQASHLAIGDSTGWGHSASHLAGGNSSRFGHSASHLAGGSSVQAVPQAHELGLHHGCGLVVQAWSVPQEGVWSKDMQEVIVLIVVWV